MRLRFQMSNVTYEVRSTIKFDKRGLVHQKTYYGRDREVDKNSILRIARQNIERKFENSSGKIIKLEIKAVYK